MCICVCECEQFGRYAQGCCIAGRDSHIYLHYNYAAHILPG